MHEQKEVASRNLHDAAHSLTCLLYRAASLLGDLRLLPHSSSALISTSARREDGEREGRMSEREKP